MRSTGQPFRLAIVAGEESGDLLGADLVRALKNRLGADLELIGVGGDNLRAEGLETFFDPDVIAIVGVTAVVRDLPRLLRLTITTAHKIVEAEPDCVVTIDSPAFNLRVARNIRRLDAKIPIIKYVCPSVWAWAPGRAAKMREFTDHVLCLLPFEPAELERLHGPPGTFVGHRLSAHPGILAARDRQMERGGPESGKKRLLILPGSRRSEVTTLGPSFVETANLLIERGNELQISIPTVPRVERLVRDMMAGLHVTPEITADENAKWEAFGSADAALAASGTVSLELALAGVPLVSCYKTDILMKLAYPFITTWSASLPNLVADRIVVPEFYDRFVRPSGLARTLEVLMTDGPTRSAQLEGFDLVREALATEIPAGEATAGIVLNLAKNGR